MLDPPAVTGYLDRLTYRPGEIVTVYATGDEQPVECRLVRLGRGPVPGREASAAIEEIPWQGTGTYRVEAQQSCVGSYATASLSGQIDSDAGLTFGLSLWTMMSGAPETQTLLELRDTEERALCLALSGGKLSLSIGADCIAESAVEVANWSWTSVVVRLAVQSAQLLITAHDPMLGESEVVTGALPESFAANDPVVTLAAQGACDVELADGYARGRSTAHFTGKLANPFLLHGGAEMPPGPLDAEVIAAQVERHGGAAWNLAPAAPGSQRYLCEAIVDAAGPLTLVNLPNQGVTGPNWDGSSVSFRERPEQYAAAHFHSTDLVDAGWDPVFSAELPAEMDSGVFGIELKAKDGSTDTIPLFLVAETGLPRKRRIAFIASTFTYLAYANEDLIGHFQKAPGHRFNDPEKLAVARSKQVHQSREFGRSLYDKHPDGSGVHYSSALRPILDMRADYVFWSYTEDAGRAFSGDMYMVEWLRRFGYNFDVVTDEQLHKQGSSCLEGYEVVVTGSHPEYTSTEMLDALQEYRDRGGNICYMGGNGFYWVTGVINPTAPIVESRRGNAGVRSWESPPGETDLFSSWEPGGLWRSRGRAPQRLLGVGMTGAGGMSRPYRLTADRRVRSEAGWFFEGLDGELIGDQGFVRGGAAGDEVDRVDFSLGTPPGTLVLASSWDHEEGTQRAIEEILQTYPGSTNGPNDPEIRADMVYFETPAGGSVFAVGSIAYFGSLLVDDGENNASRALRNVLDRMLGRVAAGKGGMQVVEQT